jgi:hypothetical protein
MRRSLYRRRRSAALVGRVCRSRGVCDAQSLLATERACWMMGLRGGGSWGPRCGASRETSPPAPERGRWRWRQRRRRPLPCLHHWLSPARPSAAARGEGAGAGLLIQGSGRGGSLRHSQVAGCRRRAACRRDDGVSLSSVSPFFSPRRRPTIPPPPPLDRQAPDNTTHATKSHIDNHTTAHHQTGESDLLCHSARSCRNQPHTLEFAAEKRKTNPPYPIRSRPARRAPLSHPSRHCRPAIEPTTVRRCVGRGGARQEREARARGVLEETQFWGGTATDYGY